MFEFLLVKKNSAFAQETGNSCLGPDSRLPTDRRQYAEKSRRCGWKVAAVRQPAARPPGVRRKLIFFWIRVLRENGFRWRLTRVSRPKEKEFPDAVREKERARSGILLTEAYRTCRLGRSRPSVRRESPGRAGRAVRARGFARANAKGRLRAFCVRPREQRAGPETVAYRFTRNR